MPYFIALTLLSVLFALPSHALNRIVGGQETTIELRPYQASLQYRTITIIHLCGASIISPKFLLTAAHCDPGTNLPLTYARIGSTAYNKGGQLLKVATFTQHPLYTGDFLDYDFAVVGFDGLEIALGSNVAVIPLTDTIDPIDGSMVTVSGWGVVSEDNKTNPQNLREVDLPVVPDSVCRETYSFLTTRQICLGGTPQGMLSACYGDSGGPAVQDGVQFALVTGGKGCERPNIPGIYARISSVRDWIRQQTGV